MLSREQKVASLVKMNLKVENLQSLQRLQLFGFISAIKRVFKLSYPFLQQINSKKKNQ